MGGHWTLRDIVDYELIATMALLDTVADRREALLRQIYEVNRLTVEAGRKGGPGAILIPVQTQHDPAEAVHLVEKLQMAGVDVFRASAAFDADGHSYATGTFVVPMAQVFARYAKDILEKQTYPEVRRSPTSPPEPPYDVSAWSLGMLLGVDHVVVNSPLGDSARLEKVAADPKLEGRVTGNGPRYVFDYRGPDGAKALNILLKAGEGVARARDRQGGRASRRDQCPAEGGRRRGVGAGAGDAQRTGLIGGQRRRHEAPCAAHRDVPALRRRQHGRRLDPMGAGAVQLPVYDAAQRRRAGRLPA
jgi:hypothetical protein